MVEQALVDRAIRAYARVLNVADPIRLQFWDSRGLTMPQLRVMFLLLDRDGQAAGELAATMRVRPATMTGLTDRLARHHLIERRPDPNDGRVVRVFLTEEGRTVVRAIEAASHAYLERIFAQMGEASVTRLVAALREFAHAAENLQDSGEFHP
ncbi:MAG: MarR family transcriptional regulator [Dehalococcoidia bacterium]|nr:MAG: MarR family transcriptional regulator [Dehalococcoidia bacterium]